MRILEVIHLRMAGNDPESLAEVVRGAVGDAADSLDLRIYRHARLEGDLLIHLHRQGAGQSEEPSETGLRLGSLLRFHGLVEHSVWVRRDGPHDPGRMSGREEPTGHAGAAKT